MNPKVINALLITGAVASISILVTDVKQRVQFSTPFVSDTTRYAVIAGGGLSLWFLYKRLS